MQVNTPLLLLLTLHLTHSLTHAGLAVPQSVHLKQDLSSQTLSVTWESDSALFDIEIYRTELMEIVLNETVSAAVDPVSGRRGWSWSSAIPLQCTSHSVWIRAREENAVSQWSPLQTIVGSDLPVNSQSQMYPQDQVVPVGSNVTFCCIVSERAEFHSFQYKHQTMVGTRLSRRSFATTVTNLPKSTASGTNIVCCSRSTTILTGAVVFVGYPPGDEGLECETRDLQKAECSWRRGRDTGFWRRSLLTSYTLNNRRCDEATRDLKRCRFDHWENSWILTATNALGAVQLNDSAHITERVRLLAPVNMSAVPLAWNSSLQWSWTVQAYNTLDLTCQVLITTGGPSDTRNFTGAGLSAVLLDGLRPDVLYSVSVRCASFHNFWRWGDWSAPYSIHTAMDRPEAPDTWVWMDSEITGQILWKPLSVSNSHGALVAYEVYQKDGEEDGWRILSLPPFASNLSITLSNRSSDLVVAVAARNPVGLSQRSVVVVPELRAGSRQPVSELVGSDGQLELTWQPWSNASRGYVVEWVPVGCADHCTVQWKRVPELTSSTTIQSGSLEAGVRYRLSVFALSDEATALIQRWQVYGQELVPDQYVKALSARQSGKNVLLSWKPADLANQRGFIRGYKIYLTIASQLELIANNAACVSVCLVCGGCVWTDGVIRFRVKKAFYPEIPGPKLTGDWSAPPAPLDVKPPPHSLVHIVESPEWDSAKKGLFPVPEEDTYDDGSIDENVEADTDSDEPTLLRYYNQLVTDGSHSNHTSDTSGSSTSSVDSAQTQVTYTGIQSPASSRWAPAYGYRPQTQPAESADEPADGFESEPQQESSSVGYKPQCSWQANSPEAENFSGSLGSPTSVTSSQFLIPDSAEEDPEPSGTWFQNLLSGKF
ncbi:LIF receptor subunit alpha a [Salminus brasiliensis]|uniref:LIF receptor subunit alpha a n=1 Tax=Salminus brasiliensis TaxID=930266 RepID=UPI003B834986